MLRDLDVDEADRLLIIVRSDPSRGYPEPWVQQHDFYDWRAQQRAFEGLAGHSLALMRLVRGAGHGSGRKDAQVQWIADELAFGWTMTE